MSEVIPDGWRVHALNGYVDILSGYPFSSSLFSDDSRRIGLIRIRDLEAQRVATFYEGEFDDTYIVRQGDVLIGMDGDFSIVKWRARSALLNQRICKIKASDGGEFFTDFLYHSLISDLQKIHSETGATTVKHLSVKDIRAIRNYYPPLSEQKKIATILSSVDDVIEKTRAQIGKLKDLKTGMMQELLTQGIGHTVFKDSQVGRIPANWSCCLLQDVAVIQTGVAKNGKITGNLIEVPYLRVANVQDGYLDLREIKTISLEVSRLNRFLLRHEDVLVNEGGDFDKLGRGFIWHNQISPCVHQNHVFVVRTEKSKLLPIFFNYLSGSEYGKKYYLGCAKQTTNLASLNSTQLKAFPVLLPPIHEQRRICEVLQSFDKRLQNSINYLETLQILKKSLMQDLLTGNVRVKVDSPETVAA